MKRYSGTLTQNAAVTATLTNDEDIELLLTQGGAGSFTVSWTGVDKWFTPTGAAPALKTAVGASDLVTLSKTGGVVYGIHYGETGPAGSAGPAGPAGIVWRRLWTNTTTYAINDAVYYAGNSYIALQPSSATNVQQPDLAPTYWGALAAGGSAGSGAAETVDTFVRADFTPLQSDTSAPFVYAQVTGYTATMAIVSNLLVNSNHSNAAAFYRAAPVLSSTDHHAQITVGQLIVASGQSEEVSVCCRMDPSAATFYRAVLYGFTAASSFGIAIDKYVAGTKTNLAIGAAFTVLPQVGDTLKLTVVGTTITAYFNNVQNCQVTDSAITTGKQCGIGGKQQSAGQTFSLSEFRFGT